MSVTSIITTYGLARFAEAAANGARVDITHIAVGDGNRSDIALGNERYRMDAESVAVSSESPDQIAVTGIIPHNVGGWTINEIAILDNSGNVIALSDGPGDAKRGPDEPLPQSYRITFYMRVANAANVVIEFSDGNGTFLPLAGGNMENGAEIIFPTLENDGEASVTAGGVGVRGNDENGVADVSSITSKGVVVTKETGPNTPVGKVESNVIGVYTGGGNHFSELFPGLLRVDNGGRGDNYGVSYGSEDITFSSTNQPIGAIRIRHDFDIPALVIEKQTSTGWVELQKWE